MARLARAVAPGMPHHVTKRGNRRQKVFFSADDSRIYLDLMSQRPGGAASGSDRSHVGHLWEGRFASSVMDKPYPLSVARYIERNPVRAGLVSRARDWPGTRRPAGRWASGPSSNASAPFLVATSSHRSPTRSRSTQTAQLGKEYPELQTCFPPLAARKGAGEADCSFLPTLGG